MTLTLDFFELKICTPITFFLRNVYSIFSFTVLFLFSRWDTDGADERTDGLET